MEAGQCSVDEQTAARMEQVMNYLRAFPEWNFYTRPDCEKEPPEGLRLSDLGENYKVGETCLVLISRYPVDPTEEYAQNLEIVVKVGLPLESTIVEEGCGLPKGFRALTWLEKGNEVYGWETPHHDAPDHWGCVIAWRPLNP